MRIFAPNEVVAKSRFWYFLSKLRKVKKANGEVVSLNQVRGITEEAEAGKTLTLESRSTRRDPQRSRTLASGSDTTRAAELTTCTRSTARCPEQTPSRLSTRIWPPVTVRVSGRFTYVPRGCRGRSGLTEIDSPRCRDREDRGHQTPIHQAAFGPQAQVPSSPPCSQGLEQEDLHSSPTIDFRIDGKGFWREHAMLEEEFCGN